MNIIILGAGAFGTAIGNSLAVNINNNVVIFSTNKQKVDEINTDNTNKSCFPNKSYLYFYSFLRFLFLPCPKLADCSCS